MNAEMYVPIKTIAEFRMVKNLSTDVEQITAVMKNSNAVTVDETGTLVRPASKSFRNTLILRDIPSATNPEEVKNIFKDLCGPDGKPAQILDISNDIGDCWYATFEDDEIALSVLEGLRTRQFNEQPIQARIKTESVLRNYFVPGSVPTDSNGNPYAYYQSGVYMMPYAPGNFQYWDGRAYRGGGGGGFDANNRGRGYGRGRRNREYTGRGAGRGNQSSKETNGVAPNPTSTRKRRGSQGTTNIQLGTADFPPLPSVAFEQSKTRYTDDFIKYSKQKIVDIVSSISKDNLTKPEELTNTEVAVENPNTELEVIKAYPKRITVADIVQMNPPSPKSGDAKAPPSPTTEKPSAEKSEKNSSTSEKSKSEKHTSSEKHKSQEKQTEKPKSEKQKSSSDKQEKQKSSDKGEKQRSEKGKGSKQKTHIMVVIQKKMLLNRKL